MFTGIVETIGTVRGSRVVAGGRRLRVDAGPLAADCAIGASLCVSGVCLTVAGIADRDLEFDVIAETLATSTLGGRRVGDRVNLERALRVGDRLDGHFVQGHVDGTATVDRKHESSKEWVIWLRPGAGPAPYIVPKGSIAVDGVSLTVSAAADGAFAVALIPTTLEHTTLSALKAGDRVNIETDLIARTVVHHLTEMSAGGRLTIGRLREAGFV